MQYGVLESAREEALRRRRLMDSERCSPTLFFHFSGVSVDGGEKISKFTNQYALSDRPDLRLIFDDYRAALVRHGIRNDSGNRYAFGTFDNGQPINRLCRSIYAANLDRFRGEDPFRCTGGFYQWADRNGLLSAGNAAKKYRPHRTPKIMFVSAPSMEHFERRCAF